MDNLTKEELRNARSGLQNEITSLLISCLSSPGEHRNGTLRAAFEAGMNQDVAIGIADVMPAVRASGLLVSLCTITVPPGVFDAGGAPDPAAAYTNLPGHVDIPCISSPLYPGDFPALEEIKSMTEILTKNMRHVLLDSYYPDIETIHRAVVDGIEYDVITAESDSQSQMTRLAVQKVTI